MSRGDTNYGGGSIEIHSPATCHELRLLGREEADEQDLAHEPAATCRVVMVGRPACKVGMIPQTAALNADFPTSIV